MNTQYDSLLAAWGVSGMLAVALALLWRIVAQRWRVVDVCDAEVSIMVVTQSYFRGADGRLAHGPVRYLRFDKPEGVSEAFAKAQALEDEAAFAERPQIAYDTWTMYGWRALDSPNQSHAISGANMLATAALLMLSTWLGVSLLLLTWRNHGGRA